MARGPKKHLKRLNAPKHWMLDKMGGIWAPRPSTGPHKLRECLPLSIILRNRLKYALTRAETVKIIMRRSVTVDRKVRTDINYPAGFCDVIGIEKTDQSYRLLFDVKGRFTLHRISADEAKFKLLRVIRIAHGKKASQGRNPFHPGHLGTVPYCVTHDGRTIRYPDPTIKVNDTIKFDLVEGKIVDILPFEIGNMAMVTRGHNMGRIGVITAKDKHPGSFDIIHLKDKRGQAFATRGANVFVVGDHTKSWISLPRGKGIRLSILEEQAKSFAASNKSSKKKAHAAQE